MDDTSFFIANGPIIAITIFIIVSLGILCSIMDGLWVVSTYALANVIIADVYLMTFVHMQSLENSGIASVDWVTNAYIMRCALALMHAFPLLCIAHLSKYPCTPFCILFGMLLVCIVKPNETACVGDYTHTDMVTFDAYGLLLDVLCVLMAMSYMLFDISVILQNTTGVVLYSVVFAFQVTGSYLLNTQFKYCDTRTTFYIHMLGIGTELVLFCYILLLASSRVNSVVHCTWCSLCNSNEGCLSCISCSGFATVDMWKDGDIDIVTPHRIHS
jgi:hypothetical protein